MTSENAMTVVVASDDPVFKPMQATNRTFFSVDQRHRIPAASEGLANIWSESSPPAVAKRSRSQPTATSLQMQHRSVGCGAPSLP